MSQPHQRQLLDHPQTLSRGERQENTPLINRARSTTTDFEEEMMAIPTPSMRDEIRFQIFRIVFQI